MTGMSTTEVKSGNQALNRHISQIWDFLEVLNLRSDTAVLSKNMVLQGVYSYTCFGLNSYRLLLSDIF